MKKENLEQNLNKIKSARVAIYGDFCLDVYWMMSPEGSEVSLETGLKAEAVERHYSSPGGAANVVNNLAALEPAEIMPIGVIGDDMHGRELVRHLEAVGVNTSSLTIQKENFETVVFTKKINDGEEGIRVDFGVGNKRSSETDAALLAQIKYALEEYDILIFNQQVPGSLTNQEFIDEANKLFEQHPESIVLLDSRHYGNRFKHVYIKTNWLEVAEYDGGVRPEGIPDMEAVRKHAQNLFDRYKKPVFVTRGKEGIMTITKNETSEVPGIQVLKSVDSVGAGDTVMSALALCLAAGIAPAVAAEFANLAASVTVQKLNITGTATGEEIILMNDNAAYNYLPELARSIRMARYHENSEIEICEESVLAKLGNIKHAVFDHDGTISTLREGWEEVMEPVMIQAVLGEQYHTASAGLYEKVRQRVLSFIDKTTGIQTIVQMEGLVEMVDEFNFVPKKDILDKFGYKEIYNDALMKMVNARTEKYTSGQLGLADYTMKGAVPFLDILREKGIKLYLASGTDRDDVINEAEVLGYAPIFEGRIYGAVGDISKYSKRMVVDNILKENNLRGEELAVFGDGPVEIQVARKAGGIAVGIASDEVRRYGLHTGKRTRLINAGAHIMVPDFSQYQLLSGLLNTVNQ
ncbi:MAG: PfkB family carbohydrate kinase [Cyclobacteriaceae bacterium]|nr:PfkB family carbohydrate kinase [Cyclobacteriaceae bacterium]